MENGDAKNILETGTPHRKLDPKRVRTYTCAGEKSRVTEDDFSKR